MNSRLLTYRFVTLHVEDVLFLVEQVNMDLAEADEFVEIQENMSGTCEYCCLKCPSRWGKEHLSNPGIVEFSSAERYGALVSTMFPSFEKASSLRVESCWE